MAWRFGRTMTNLPTPRSISNLFDGMAGFSGILAGWLTTAPYISHNFSDIASSILTMLLIPSFLYFKRFFGTEMGDQKKVDIKDVTEIKDTPTK